MPPPKISCERRRWKPSDAALLALLLLVQSPPADAELLFAAPYRSFDSGFWSRPIAVGDLNGDGHLDLVVGSSYGSASPFDEVSLYFGNGDGTFPNREPLSLPQGVVPFDLALSDLNLDGALDLVVADPPASRVRVYWGYGNGTFAPPSEIVVGSQPVSVLIVDLNADDRPDIAVASRGSRSISVIRTRGTGFLRPVESFIGEEPVALAAADFDHDGDMDLASANGTRGYSVLLQDVGQFVARTFDAGRGFEIAAGDLNADGFPDIAIARDDDRATELRFGRGDGTFDGVLGLYTPAPRHESNRPIAALIMDTTGDCRNDLVVAHRSSVVTVHAGRAAGGFEELPVCRAAEDLVGMATGDFDRDGLEDVVVSSIRGQLNILPGNRNGTFGTNLSYTTGRGPTALASADLNADGRSDLVVGCGDGEGSGQFTVSVLLGSVSGGFLPRTDYPLPQAMPTGVSIGDFDEDGAPDLIFENAWGASLRHFRGRGDGTFLSPEAIPVAGTTHGIVSDDFDKDGHLDLAVTCESPSVVQVLPGNGDGSFRPGIRYATDLSPWSIALGDLNGDDWPDLAVTTTYPTQYGATIFLNAGDGSFAESQTVNVGDSESRPNGLAMVDYDADGHEDLIVTTSSSSVHLYTGNGSGTVEQRGSIFVGSTQGDIAAADFDRDGALDLVIGLPYRLALLTGGGNGSFRRQGDYGPGTSSNIIVGQFNHDNRPDLLVADPAGFDNVTLLLNLGNSDPDVSAARAVPKRDRPRNRQLVPVSIEGVFDPDDDPFTIRVTGVTQDEPAADPGSAPFCPDAVITDEELLLRLETSSEGGPRAGNGRVYAISFSAVDARGAAASGIVTVCVPHEARDEGTCIDDGQTVNSLDPCLTAEIPSGPANARLLVGDDEGGQSRQLSYVLPQAGKVRIEVFDLAGRRRAVLEDATHAAGRHEMRWDTSRMASGLYFVRLLVDETTTITRRAFILR